jgi:hypothetical protein
MINNIIKTCATNIYDLAGVDTQSISHLEKDIVSVLL